MLIESIPIDRLRTFLAMLVFIGYILSDLVICVVVDVKKQRLAVKTLKINISSDQLFVGTLCAPIVLSSCVRILLTKS